MMVKSKRKVLDKLTTVSKKIGATAALGVATAQNFFATEWLTGGTEDVNVDISTVDGQQLVNNALKIVLGIIAVGGIFTIAQGFQTWNNGQAEENTTMESKGIKKMLAGAIAVAAPAIFIFLLST